KCADEEQHDVPQAWEVAVVHAGETNGPPARHQQKPRPDRPVQPCESQVRAAERRRETVDPVSGRISDGARGLGPFSSGVPVRVSNVPRPVLILLESGTGLVSASLKLGPRAAGAEAAWQTLVRISETLATASLSCPVTCGGMPHHTPLSLVYLSILFWAAS